MFCALKGNLRNRSGNGFTQFLRRAAQVIVLSLLASVAASAYTVVLKSGRRINIPSSFTVTSLTLTYEAAPGLNVTLLLATIDIPATERANSETAGALLKRAEPQAEPAKVRTQASSRRRELTQADIERGRSERQKSEEAYERRRVELGLPALEDSRRRSEEEAKRLREESQKNEAETTEAEAYWRNRATELRNEMSALDAQINYVRSQLAASPDSSSLESYTFIGGASPRFGSRRVTTRFPAVTGNPGFMRGINSTGTQSGVGFLAYGGSGGQAGIRFNGRVGRGNFGWRGRGGFMGTPLGLYGIPNANYSYDQSDLISSLRELETARVGLQARWRQLEEDARRAGAQPGWLRP